jgi:UDP-N-acetylmuramoyl-L-alanyl-D-glutamate--2,6-diaminopimelate ligase
MEGYYSAKRAFVGGECVVGPKRVVINLDDEYGKRLFREIPDGVCKIGFGEDKEAHFRVRKVRYGSTETEFELECPAGVIDVRSPMIGRFNVQNVLAALAIGWIEGREIGVMVDRLEEFEGSPGRLESVREGQGFNVLVDYAHTSDALKNILSVLREVTDGRLLLVFGCGGDRDQKKRPAMTRAAQEFCDFAWATADNPRSEPLDSIFEQMRAGVREPGRIRFVKNRRRAIGLAIEQARPRDCLVIAGKGHETYQEFNNTVVPFDDRRVARELLRLLKASTGEVAQW